MGIHLKRKLGGVYLRKNKYLTEEQAIRSMNPPKKIILPMNMHIGKEANVIVKVGDYVKIGTLIGEKNGLISANIHSSISGIVEKIETRTIGNRETTCVIIKNDFEDRYDMLNTQPNTFIEGLKEFGIVGMGGAGFPTDVKLTKGKQLMETLIINAVECEPFVTSDRRIILEKMDEFIAGIYYIQQAIEVKKVIIAIERSSREAIKALKKQIPGKGVQLFVLPDYYPQGAEKILIKSILGKEVPNGKLPADVHVSILNVSTVAAIYQGLKKNSPLVNRIVTVSGAAVKNPGNIEVRIGTPIEEVFEYCGGFKEVPAKVINGGPMMGRLVQQLSEPVTKTTSLLLTLSQEETKIGKEQNCIRCSECVSACPVNLQPVSISNAYRSGDIAEAERLGALSCIDCGACSYICPSKISILADIREAKMKIMEKKRK